MASRFLAWRKRSGVRADRRPPENGTSRAVRVAVRCGIYTRKSTEEGLDQSFNTLDAQREAAEAFINSQRQEGWEAQPQKYDDGGYTGANMDRPALKRLLADVQSGAVNCVVVYKVDRLSRSLLDFARIMEVLDKHGATFVSVTQQFNTTSSMGRLTLNILLSFAQFEREMISERTRDKMSAARRKGKWVGGNPVLGYDVAPQGGSLLVNKEEAQRVREIFALYLEMGSLIPVVEELDRRGWRMKSWTTREGRQAGGKSISKNSLYNLLSNMVYVGKVEFGGQVYEGEHDRIVDDETWNRVQTLLNRNGRHGGRNIGNKYSALLKGLVRCGTCGVGMTHTYVNKKDRLYRYYVCLRAHQRGWAQCETRSVSAPAIENAVRDQLRGIGRSPAMLGEVLRQLNGHQQKELAEAEREKAQVDQELKQIAQEMKARVSAIGRAGPAAELAADRLADLQYRVSHLNSRLPELRQRTDAIEARHVDARDVEAALNEFDSLWEQMVGWEKEKLIQTLVEHVCYDGKTGTVTLGFRSVSVKELCGWASAMTEKYEPTTRRS
jgi:site-specific DNA recombinase